MSIEFACKNCASQLRVEQQHIGKQARCPACQTLNIVPESSDSKGQDGRDWQFPPERSVPTAQPLDSSYPTSTFQGGSANHYQYAHRGGLVLAMGIMSLVCNLMFVPGILAWVLGRADLRQMDAGLMDPEGRGLTQAGMIIGIIMTLLQVAGIVLYIGFIIVMILIGIAGGM